MAIRTQSKPLIPGLMAQPIRKNIIVYGAKRAKRRGHTQMLNAELNNPGLIIHHTNNAKRGPKSIKIVTAQHILLPHQIKIEFFKSFNYLIMARTTIIIKKTIKIKKRIFRIPQPALPAPLKPKTPEKINNTTAMIASIQNILITYSFAAAIHKINSDYFMNGKDKTVVNINQFVCKKHPESYRFLPGNSNSFILLRLIV